MAASLDIASSLQTIPARKDILRKSFKELEARGSIIALCSSSWKELDEQISGIEAALKKRFDEIVEKEKVFEAKMKEVIAALDERDGAVAAREQASLARVQEQRDAAVAAILEQKRKWNEERQRLGREGSVKNDGDLTSLKVELKQADVLEDEDEEKEAAVQAMEAEEPETKPADEIDVEETATVKEGISKNKVAPKPAVTARPQLKTLCENMDGSGLRKYILEQKKEFNAIQGELPSALRCAIDPARLILKALEGYYSADQVQSQSKKKDAGFPSNRRVCVILLEALAEVLTDTVLGGEHSAVSPNIKSSAKEVADLWKSNLNLESKDAVALQLDIQNFLQLLATFELASEYNEDELCKLAALLYRRKQTPILCRTLGLTARVPELIENLVKEGKHIQATSFANEFGLFEKFPPVPLLKAYLKDIRKASQASMKTGDQSPAAQNERLARELAAIKAVLKCIDEYKLEAQFPSENLQKRVAQLEKAKSEKKRSAEAARTQSKKPRVNGAVGPHVGTFRPPDRPQLAGGLVSPGLPGHNYVPGYGGGARSPRSLGAAYPFPGDGLSRSLYGSPSFPYGTYQYGTGPSAYQGSFLR